MDISIVTVCLNGAGTIRETIDSVLSQKDAGVEYLVIDGGSTDGTREIVASYGERIDTFISEPDRGIADAFNKGIAAASGRVVGLLNADDVLLPGALDRVRGWFAAHPDTDVLHADVLLHEGDRLLKRLKPSGRWWFPWRLVLFNHPATFVRRGLYAELGGFDPGYRVAMDVEIFGRWVRRGADIRYLPEPLVRMRSGGLSGREPLRGYAEARAALLANGFSPLLVNLQYLFRCAGQQVVALRGALRSGR